MFWTKRNISEQKSEYFFQFDYGKMIIIQNDSMEKSLSYNYFNNIKSLIILISYSFGKYSKNYGKKRVISLQIDAKSL